MSGNDVRAILKGVDERGGLNNVDFALSGHQGGNDIGDAVAVVKERNPDAIYACDPVLGNAVSVCHVATEVQDLIRARVFPQADLITQNQFEPGFITNTSDDTLEATLESVDSVRSLGPSTLPLTSVQR